MISKKIQECQVQFLIKYLFFKNLIMKHFVALSNPKWVKSDLHSRARNPI